MPAPIREFEPGDEDSFRRLNEEWIRAYFSLEPKDLEVELRLAPSAPGKQPAP